MVKFIYQSLFWLSHKCDIQQSKFYISIRWPNKTSNIFVPIKLHKILYNPKSWHDISVKFFLPTIYYSCNCFSKCTLWCPQNKNSEESSIKRHKLKDHVGRRTIPVRSGLHEWDCTVETIHFTQGNGTVVRHIVNCVNQPRFRRSWSIIATNADIFNRG